MFRQRRELVAALEALTAEVRRQNEIYGLVTQVTAKQTQRALADMVSDIRRRSPGDGGPARY